MLRYGRSQRFAYLRILELEGIGKRKLNTALDDISKEFQSLDGIIIDVRNNPGGDDSTVLAIASRFCNTEMVAFHRKTKTGPGDKDFSPLKTWRVGPHGGTQFTGPVVLLTCDAVFSGAEVFALVMKQFPHVTIIGDHTNGIFSYQLEKKLPNGWRYSLSYQVYFSADMVCYEAVGVPPDVELLNTRADLEAGEDPLITTALELLRSKSRQSPA
ncbi:MAG: S41 family peptidase [Hyphomicrobiales bacterium]